jgi:hypothetical protein
MLRLYVFSTPMSSNKNLPTVVETFRWNVFTLDIFRKQCRDVAMLRLLGCRQRTINFGRCLL